MLRHYEQHNGGVKNYTKSILEQLLTIDRDHEFVFIYQNPDLIGTYGDNERVKEVAIRSPSIFTWDQCVVPWVEKTEKLDVIFNPKYSLPLAARCPCVFVCHGLDWYVMPWGSTWLNRLSHRYLVPKYAKKADAVIAVSESTGRDAKQFLSLEESKVRVVYHGINNRFLSSVSDADKTRVAEKYHLPERYLLFVSGIYPPKNFDRLLRAYAQVGPRLGVKLVVAGSHIYLCEHQFKLADELHITDHVNFAGWVEHDELPAFYAGAEGLLLPSLYEGCPSPLLEAMAVGCPILTGNRSGMKDVAGDAALLVNPDSVGDIAAGICKLVERPDLCAQLRVRGKQRARRFSWRQCGELTLDTLEAVAGRSHSLTGAARG